MKNQDKLISPSTAYTSITEHTRKKQLAKIRTNPLSITEQLEYYIKNGRSFMLHGKSGIGKSRRIHEIDPTFVSLTLRNGMLPEEVIGKDFTDEHGVNRWTPPSFYNSLIDICEREPEKNHVLFLDELTNVNEHEQSLAYDIVLNRCIKPNFGKLPDNCVVVAAGNAKNESEAAYNMPEPLFRRFHGHVYLPLDLNSFLEWGSERRPDSDKTKIHPIISRFLAAYPKLLYTEYDPEKEGENFAIDPRAWEQVSDIIYDNDDYIVTELIANKIGDANTTMLTAFASKIQITKEDILNDDFNIADIPRQLDEKYALTLSLRDATEHEVEKVRNFISKYLDGEMLAKFDYIWVNKDVDRAMIIAELKEKEKEKLEDTKILFEEIQSPEPDLSYADSKMIKLTDFCDQNWKSRSFTITDKKAIYCADGKQENWLRKAMRNLGGDYQSRDSIGNVYYLNSGYTSSSSEYITDCDVEVFKFDEVDFTGALPSEEIAQVESYIKEYNYKEVRKFENFCNATDKKGIRCRSMEQVEYLYNAFRLLNKTWCWGDPYIADNHRQRSTGLDDTFYTNKGSIVREINLKPEHRFEFSEMDFSSVFDLKTIKKMKKQKVITDASMESGK